MNKIVFLFFLSLLGYSSLAVASTQANTNQIQTKAISQNNQRNFLGQLEKHSKKVIGMVVSVILIGGAATLLFLKRNNNNKQLGAPHGTEGQNIQGKNVKGEKPRSSFVNNSMEERKRLNRKFALLQQNLNGNTDYTEELLNSNHGNTQSDIPAESVGSNEINTNNTLNGEVLKNLTRKQEGSELDKEAKPEQVKFFDLLDAFKKQASEVVNNIKSDTNHANKVGDVIDAQGVNEPNTGKSNFVKDIRAQQIAQMKRMNELNGVNTPQSTQNASDHLQRLDESNRTSTLGPNGLSLEDLEKKIEDRVHDDMYTSHNRTIDDQKAWYDEKFELIKTTFGEYKVQSFLKTPKRVTQSDIKILLEKTIDGYDFDLFKLIVTYYEKYSVTPVINDDVMYRLVANILNAGSEYKQKKGYTHRLDILNFLIQEKNESVLNYLKSSKKEFPTELKVNEKFTGRRKSESVLVGVAYESIESVFDVAWNDGKTDEKNNPYLIAACLYGYKRAGKNNIKEAKNILNKVIQAQKRGVFYDIKLGYEHKRALQVIFAKTNGPIEEEVVRILLDKMDVKEIAWIDGIATISTSKKSSSGSKRHKGFLRSELEKMAKSKREQARELYNTIYDVYYQRIAEKIKGESKNNLDKLVMFVQSVTNTLDKKNQENINSPILAQIKGLGPKNNLENQVDYLSVEGSNVDEKDVQKKLSYMILEDLGYILAEIPTNYSEEEIAVLDFLLDRIIGNIPTVAIADEVLGSFNEGQKGQENGDNFLPEIKSYYLKLREKVNKQKELLKR